nr:MAG TPA: hypothetical protein [Caudoviricetes sp.]DAU08274.1 MAG TPA: hypothetical protein [Caudoviricetes sp.]
MKLKCSIFYMQCAYVILINIKKIILIHVIPLNV